MFILSSNYGANGRYLSSPWALLLHPVLGILLRMAKANKVINDRKYEKRRVDGSIDITHAMFTTNLLIRALWLQGNGDNFYQSY